MLVSMILFSVDDPYDKLKIVEHTHFPSLILNCLFIFHISTEYIENFYLLTQFNIDVPAALFPL